MLNQNIVTALKADSVKKTLEGSGFVVVGSSRQELKDLLVEEQARWAQVVKKTGFKIN